MLLSLNTFLAMFCAETFKWSIIWHALSLMLFILLPAKNVNYNMLARPVKNAVLEWIAISLKLEHRKLGWKVLILKYDFCKSLSKEMWCKMADTKNILTTYFKRWKMHVILGKSFLCPWTRKWFPLIMNGKLEMSWFVHIFLQN